MKIADLWAKLSIRPDKKSFAVADRLLGTVKTALAGVVAYRTVTWFAGLVQQTSEAADHFAKLAQSTGVAIGPLQQLAYAADLSGVPLDSLSTAMSKFSKTAATARDGSESAQAAFRKLGVDTRKLLDGSLSLEDAFMETAETLSKMEDGPAKTALAMEVFGRSGAKLIPMLNEGREGLAKLREEFEKTGGQFGEDDAAGFEELNDDISRVRYEVKGSFTQALISLLPTLKGLVKQALAWVRANKKLIQQKLAAIIRGLIAATKFLVRIVGTAAKVISFFHDNLGLLGVILASVAATMLIFKAASIGAALASAAAWFAAAAPLILIAILIAAAILLVEDLWTWINGGESVLGHVHEWFVDAFVGWIDKAYKEFRVFWTWLEDKIDSIGNSLADLLDDVGLSGFKKLRESRKALRETYAELDRTIAAGEAAQAAGDVAMRAAQMQEITGYDTFPGMGMEGVPRLPVTAVPTNQVELAPKFEINVTAGAGADGNDISTKIREGAKELWDGYMRDTAASLGGE